MAPPPQTGADFTPAWARHAIWYQILPDRFCNVVAINRGEAGHAIELTVPAGRTWTDAWDGGTPQQLGPDRLALRLAGLSGTVLQAL